MSFHVCNIMTTFSVKALPCLPGTALYSLSCPVRLTNGKASFIILYPVLSVQPMGRLETIWKFPLSQASTEQ